MMTNCTHSTFFVFFFFDKLTSFQLHGNNYTKQVHNYYSINKTNDYDNLWVTGEQSNEQWKVKERHTTVKMVTWQPCSWSSDEEHEAKAKQNTMRIRHATY